MRSQRLSREGEQQFHDETAARLLYSAAHHQQIGATHMTALETRPRIGDKVSVNDPKYPGVWTVKSLGPKNATLLPDDGGRGLRAPYGMLTEPGTAPTLPAPVTASDLFDLGAIIRIDSGKWRGDWVVIKDDGGDKVNLARLGGGGGRYLRHTRHGLTKVSLADVLKG